jgi:DNA-binding protein HU-beta
VNKAELVEALTGRLGDKKAATAALDAVLEEIQRTVSKGGKVSIAGFGVFEKRVRGARTARNPRTGEAVKVKKTSVPAFRAGQGFKDVVAGKKKIAAAPKKAATKATATKTAATKTAKATATRATAKTAAAKKTAPAKKTTTAAKKTAATKTAAKKTTATKTTAKKTTARKTATKSAAKRAPRTR